MMEELKLILKNAQNYLTNKAVVKWIVILSLFGVVGIFSLIGLLFYLSFDLPKIDTLSDYNPPMKSQILAKDGTVLAELGLENREVVELKDIPKVIQDAFLSAEDSAFYEHTGVDYFGMFRAFLVNLKTGKMSQGGSTITQQVAKSLLLNRSKTIARKLKDIMLARKIEQRFSKEEILFLYLNQAYLGGGFYGVKSAFKGYFNKELTEVTVAESAMIAGLLVAPGKYSPYVKPEYAKIRQHYVLKRMYENNKITKEQYEEALNEKTKFYLRNENELKAGYFTEWVRQRVSDLVGNDNFLENGFKVTTTLDWNLQKVAEASVFKGAKDIDKRQGFKGPLGHISITESDGINLDNFAIENRKNIMEERSSYFTINESNEKIYEFNFDQKQFDELKVHHRDVLTSLAGTKFLPGMKSGDSLVDFLEKEKLYRAVVTLIDDTTKLVFVDVAGVPGVIPQENFAWAKKREISETTANYAVVSKPSSILTVGDIIYVEVLSTNASVFDLASANSLDTVKKNAFLNKTLKDQKYLKCALDQYPDAQSSLLAIHPFTGEILSFVGGLDYAISKFNRVLQSKRQPGSSFKPMLYAAGLENGFNPASIIIDSPEALSGAEIGLNWKPTNYDGEFKGPVTFRNALEQSRNVPTIRIADQLGVSKIKKFVERIGFKAKIDEDLGMSLGTFGADLFDLVSTYAIFPNGGRIVDPISIVSIVDRYGNEYRVEESFKKNEIKALNLAKTAAMEASKNGDNGSVETEGLSTSDSSTQSAVKKNRFLEMLGDDIVYDPRLAYIMTNLLRGVIWHGTGNEARSVSANLGGKTGTTNSYVDAWFIGFSPNVVAGVWTGFDDNKTLGWGETGAKAALPIWKRYMESVVKTFGEGDFTVPNGIVNIAINKQTGKPVESGDGVTPFMESFVEGTGPDTQEHDDVNLDEISQDKNKQIWSDDEYYENQ